MFILTEAGKSQSVIPKGKLVSKDTNGLAIASH